LKTPEPIAALRASKPDLFVSPPFWKSRLSDLEAAAQSAKVLHCEEIGQSAGGRSILAFSLGEFEPVSSTATISSAMASDRPGSYYDHKERQRPSLTLIGSIHGGETEGLALALSLIHLLETGKDTLGRERPHLVESLQRIRLNIIPCLNPDGRAAAAVDHLSGAGLEDLFLVQQGVFPDGTLFRGRRVKETQPIPAGMLAHQGGYYNADGVNLQHDDFFGPKLAPESMAIRDLFRREIPDAFLTMHAHGGPAAFLVPDSFISPGMQNKQVEAATFGLARLHAAGIPFLPSDQIVTPPWSFFFQTWLHHMTGATPLLFEFCHGMEMHPQSLETILETGFQVFEAWIDYNLSFGPRPAAHEMFGAITPAK